MYNSQTVTEKGQDETAPPFPLRPGTNDDVIYRSVVVNNEYRLPTRLPKESVVIDIGAHVGMFSALALTRGAGIVYAFEPEPSNLNSARHNLAPFGDRVRLDNRAVWRSDIAVSELRFWASRDQANTGGGTVIWDTEGPVVEAVPFDHVIDSICRDGDRRVHLVKMDCEGAEFPILLTSKRLDQIDSIVGEYHELCAQLPTHVQVSGVDQFSRDVLEQALEEAGFIVEFEPQATSTYGELGLFFARRRAAMRGASVSRLRRWLGSGTSGQATD